MSRQSVPTKRKGLFELPTADSLDADIAWGVQKGLATGSEKFKAEIETLTNVAQALQPRGPKKGFKI